jgi:adenine C2-methylase RlmN of 23S rRNA A2503 and tRNA A37
MIFKMMLDKYGIACSIRLKRGVDIGAGCGQLLTSSSKNE